MSLGALWRRLTVLVTASPLLVVLPLLFFGAAPSRAETQRPNIVLLYVDDLRWDVFGHTGYPVSTPAIDRLAEEGFRFTNSFVISSLCAPSRATLQTGVYPHLHRVTGNMTAFEYGHYPVLPQMLQQRGYRTAMIGKWHLGGGTGRRPGYDHWFAHVGETEYRNPLFDVNGILVRRTGYSTDLLTEEAVKFIQANRTRPFFVQLAYAGVHEPFSPARRHYGMLDDTNLPIRPTVLGPNQPLMRDYIETLASIDESVAAIRASLAQAGILDQTAIIFTSDNGFMFGEHERGDKRLFFEESIRVPLIVRYPGLVAAPGGAAPQMVLSLDLPPTILDLAGAPVPAHMQGRSIVPLLRGDNPTWRTEWVYEYFRELAWPQLSTMISLRTDRYKYVEMPAGPDMFCYFSGEPILIDLVNDPYETHNLARDPAHAALRRRMEARLRAAQAELQYRDVSLAEQQVASRIMQLVAKYPFFAASVNTYYPQGYQGLESRVCSVTRW